MDILRIGVSLIGGFIGGVMGSLIHAYIQDRLRAKRHRRLVIVSRQTERHVPSGHQDQAAAPAAR